MGIWMLFDVRLKVRATLLLLCSLFLSACSGSQTGLSLASSDNHLVISDPFLASSLSVDGQKEDISNGVMHIVVPVKNLTNMTLKLEYQFYWYNQQGLELNDSLAWQALTVNAGEVATIAGTAPSADAIQYRIGIRQLNP
ncbi:hypothetical protein C5F63_04335 [Photobacterium damselae subsp. damselae]|nr:hypothetical protein C5F63_04335 [Photobacterium damselae subsp. damselae]